MYLMNIQAKYTDISDDIQVEYTDYISPDQEGHKTSGRSAPGCRPQPTCGPPRAES